MTFKKEPMGVFPVCLKPWQKEFIRRLAFEQNISQASVIRRLIDKEYAKRENGE